MLLRAKGHADNNYCGTEDIAGATGSKLVYTLTLLSGGCRADSVLVSTVDMLLWESLSSFWHAKLLANSVASLLLVFLSVFTQPVAPQQMLVICPESAGKHLKCLL